MTTPLFHLSLLSRTEQNKVKALIYLLDLHALKMVERNRAISCCFYERRSDIAHIKIALRAKFYLQRLKRKPADKNWEGTNSAHIKIALRAKFYLQRLKRKPADKNWEGTNSAGGVIKTLAVLDIETKPHYWLTVFAQDHGVVPLFSSVEIYIEVLNENDNIPLSVEPVYYASIVEESPGGKPILQIEATDNDVDDTIIDYQIITGNPGGLFSINSSTGLISTTTRLLNREIQDEYILEVQISDNGEPRLSSTTRVIVTIEDINDNSPEFEQAFYKVQIPASPEFNQPVFQNDEPVEDFDVADAADDDTWDTYSPDQVQGLDRVMRALAYDKDIGDNGRVSYSIRSGKGRNKFKIDNTTGMVYASKGFEVGQYEINIRASDAGNPPKSSTCRVSISVIPVPATPSAPPVIKSPQPVQTTENDTPGFLVASLQATDADNDYLWYDIVDGDPRNEFYIGRDNGNILLAKQLDYEVQKEYCLNISVTDAINTVYTQLNVSVIDINDHRPEFSETLYKVEISESVAVGTEILMLKATDKDNEGKLIFSLHAARNKISLETFKVDSLTGTVTLAYGLDRESLAEHLLTVMVRDSGTPSNRNYARVLIIVHDQNDHTPQFSEKILQGKVYESATVGPHPTIFRKDPPRKNHDKGDNARITYSISSGNVGNVFAIDPDLGIIQVARELDLSVATEYTLYIRATDHGHPSLSTTIPAHIMLTMADNAPPRFVEKEVAAEIYEDKSLGSFVAHMNVRSTSSLQFDIIDGNINESFMISPSTGVIITQKLLDYETTKFYNLTVKAVNMASASAVCNVIIHILDKNDNVPYFLQAIYSGTISEAAPIDSLSSVLSPSYLLGNNQ
ncbi:Cadherin domain [Popillia japonica]|uniref:Cadherin domain n=1 Tax=Popillia japonica TaxID=7064 RepID=A0AAW1N481_POPJA